MYVAILQAIYIGVQHALGYKLAAPVPIKCASYVLCIPRYLKRGVSDTGKVANDVEVEQVRLISAAQLIANLVNSRK